MPDLPRFAYLITSYILPDQVLRLASVLRRGSPGAWIVVHHDDRRCALERARLEALGVRLVDPPTVGAWGEASQLAMVLRCLHWLLDRTDFDWVVLLSGQDYPIRRVAEIERSVAVSEFDGFIETRPCAAPPWCASAGEFPGRYHFRWRRIPASAAALLEAATKGNPLAEVRTLPNGTWLGVGALRTPFGARLICHYGSDWFTLSHAAVESVRRFCDGRPDVLRYYGRTLIPTESFVQTALANEPTLRLSGDYRRYSVWDRPYMTGPRTLRLRDIEPIMASGADIARKFDESVDEAVLDEIDGRVHSS